MTEESNPAASARYRRWKVAWLVLAAAYAWPVISTGYERVLEVTRRHREQLIVQHQLWELHPEYAGSPRDWTRFASRLLTDRQLMSRIRAKYGEAAEQIELDYGRDLFIAQAEVVVVAGAIWALPLAALYGIGLMLARRPRLEPAHTDRNPPVDDSRYRA